MDGGGLTYGHLPPSVEEVDEVEEVEEFDKVVTGMPGASPGEIAAGTGINLNTVKSNVRRMAEDNQLGSDGEGRYFAPTTQDATATGATVQPGGFTGLQGLQLQDGGAAA